MKHIEYTYKPNLLALLGLALLSFVSVKGGLYYLLVTKSADDAYFSTFGAGFFIVIGFGLMLALVKFIFYKNVLIITDTEISVPLLINKTTVQLANINDMNMKGFKIYNLMFFPLLVATTVDQHLIIQYGKDKKRLVISRNMLPSYRAFENVCEVLATQVEAAKNTPLIQPILPAKAENPILETQSIQHNFCSNCGSSLTETSAFCSSCGTPSGKNTLDVQPIVKKDTVIYYDEVLWYRKNWFFWLSFVLFPPLLLLIFWTGESYYTLKDEVKPLSFGNRVFGSIYAVITAPFYIPLLIVTLNGIFSAVISYDYSAVVADSSSLSRTRTQAERGDAAAQHNLAVMYDNGEGVPKNKTEAVKWYRKAAEQGLAEAQFNLALMYHNGEGVPADKTEAVKWCHKAAEQGLVEAQLQLGNMYHKGEGVPADKTEAVKWYRKAAEQGPAEAQFNLGSMYKNGEGVPVDKTEAMKWYRKAAEQGLVEAQYNLALMYHKGEGVPADKTEAVKWFHKASEQGYAAAQFNLAVMYDSGEGVPVNKTEAVKWYRKAAEQGDADAQYNLGLLEKAQRLSQAAAEAESQAAKTNPIAQSAQNENLIPHWYRVININESDTLNMRKKASTKSPIVYKIPFSEDCILGTEETQIYLNKVWRKIKVNNRTGWVNSEFLSATNSVCVDQ